MSNTVGHMVLATVYRAMMAPAFVDSPMGPWRDRPDQACLDRVCERHESCARREAFCAFEAWFTEQNRRLRPHEET